MFCWIAHIMINDDSWARPRKSLVVVKRKNSYNCWKFIEACS